MSSDKFADFDIFIKKEVRKKRRKRRWSFELKKYIFGARLLETWVDQTFSEFLGNKSL